MRNIISIFKPVAFAYVLTLIIFLVVATLLTFTEFPQNMIPSVTIVTSIICVMFAGSVAARNAKSKGWLHGMYAGLFYMLILYVISSITLNSFKIDTNTLIMLALGLGAGSLGGIIGINLKIRKR